MTLGICICCIGQETAAWMGQCRQCSSAMQVQTAPKLKVSVSRSQMKLPLQDVGRLHGHVHKAQRPIFLPLLLFSGFRILVVR